MIDIEAAVGALTLDQKCQLVAGRSIWRTRAVPEAGIPQLKMSDGPTGVRGEHHGDSGTPGVAIPSGITLGATWDPDLLAEIGDLLGREARRKRAHILLGPTINIQRTPLGGRTFECYSEDPELTGALAVRYVEAVQAHEVAVTVKHFVCNDTEIDRMRVDVDVDERTLRELYLRPFERTVKEADAWGIMSAYNRVGGEHCAQNHRLLTEILRDEWGFDGFVVSDWFGVHEPISAANAGLNLEMPGPTRVYGDRLVAAVQDGNVAEAQIDELVRGLLVAANRTRADERDPDEPEESVDDPGERALTRRAAIAGTVLLRNEPGPGGQKVLPLRSDAGSIAVIGPNAVIDRCMGGGSSSLRPFGHRTFLDALRDRLPDVEIEHQPGVRTDRLAPLARAPEIRTPDGAPGLRIEFVDGDDWHGPTAHTATSSTSMLRFFGSTPAAVDPRRFSVRVTGTYVPHVDGIHTFGVVSTGPAVLTITHGDETVDVFDDPENELPRSQEMFGAGSVEVLTEVELRAGRPVEIAGRWKAVARHAFSALRLGVRPPEPADLMDRAVALAARSDATIVMVGTNDEWETEGQDRTAMGLPTRQDELVEKVVTVNPNTAVIVNAGSPVDLDWAADDHPSPAPAVLTSFFAGQEQAEALVDVVLGLADPGGRLPITYPRRLEESPAFLHHQPDHGADGLPVQRYGEGLHVGHRWYEARHIPPRFWFGHGLSYGDAEWGVASADRSTIAAGDGVTVTVPVTATGDRDVTVVVQGYVAPVTPSVPRPCKELKVWSKRVLSPGTTEQVALHFGPEAFRHWNAAAGAWTIDPGEYHLVVARSAGDEHARVGVTVG